MDVPHPSNFADEGRRILFTFAGVGIAVIVMFLADLLRKRTAKAVPEAPQATHRLTAGEEGLHSRQTDDECVCGEIDPAEPCKSFPRRDLNLFG